VATRPDRRPDRRSSGAVRHPGFRSPRIQYGIQDDAWIHDGPGTLKHRLDFVKALGVTTVRFGIRWDVVAPTRPARALASSDPAYRWDAVDPILQGLRARGIAPLVTLYGTAPWANGGRKPNVAPTSSTIFADFAYAAAKRYSFVRSGRSGTSRTSGCRSRARPRSCT
jgi:hypothetical protein